MIFLDQHNNTITLPNYPKRIVSLVPSQSELIWELGLKEDLVGITKFCIHPKEMHQSIIHIGGTKTLDIERIKSLKPDLIIGNKEENEKSQIEELVKYFPIWMSDIYTLIDAYKMILGIGLILNKEIESKNIVTTIKKSFYNLPQINKRVLYFIWRKPYMVAGRNTFIGNILKEIGFYNCILEIDSRYPVLNMEEIKRLSPEVILLSSEPYPFTKKHLEEFKAALPTTTICLVDGESFSWYGNRLLQSRAEFERIISLISF